ncbi:hypothetical protein K9L97_02855 [Candidatus Woesearchaeota archaeon]|nr:hypothetical protein [Candidatus Woesearchaeota archaeon]
MKTKLTAIILTILGLGITTTTKAQDLTAYLEKKIINKNMFYGMNFVDEKTGKDKAMMQPYIEITKGPITYANWTNFDLKNGRTDEIDHTLKLTKQYELGQKDNITISPSIAMYTFPNSNLKDEKAIALETTYTGNTMPFDINIRIEKILNGQKTNGVLINSTISKTTNITNNITSTAKTSTAFNNKYFSNNSGITHFDISANISYNLGKGLAITAEGTYQQKIDKEFKQLIKTEPYFKFAISKSIE